MRTRKRKVENSGSPPPNPATEPATEVENSGSRPSNPATEPDNPPNELIIVEEVESGEAQNAPPVSSETDTKEDTKADFTEDVTKTSSDAFFTPVDAESSIQTKSGIKKKKKPPKRAPDEAPVFGDPVTALAWYAKGQMPKLNFEFEEAREPNNVMTLKATLEISGRRYEATGRNKKEAKQLVATVILREEFQMDASDLLEFYLNNVVQKKPSATDHNLIHDETQVSAPSAIQNPAVQHVDSNGKARVPVRLRLGPKAADHEPDPGRFSLDSDVNQLTMANQELRVSLSEALRENQELRDRVAYLENLLVQYTAHDMVYY